MQRPGMRSFVRPTQAVVRCLPPGIRPGRLPENDLIRGHCGYSGKEAPSDLKPVHSGICRRSIFKETQAVSFTLSGHTPRRGALAPQKTNLKE